MLAPSSSSAYLTTSFVLCVLFGASAASADAGILPASVDVHSRALQPGEPLRIEVTADEAPLFLEGEFLGRTVSLSPAGRDSAGRSRWSGWSMIGLDQEPGPQAVDVRGRSVTGRTIVGTRAVTIDAKVFPEEQLSVPPRYVEPPPEVQDRLARERIKLDAIYSSRRQVQPPLDPFVRPVPGERTSPFGTRRIFNGTPRSPHSGLDLRAATGTPVQASGPGRIVLAEDLYYSGNTVIVDHGGGLFTLYAHLSAIAVREGDEVESGFPLGQSGATGRVTGPHLHWGAKIGDEPFDPTALLDEQLFD